MQPSPLPHPIPMGSSINKTVEFYNALVEHHLLHKTGIDALTRLPATIEKTGHVSYTYKLGDGTQRVFNKGNIRINNKQVQIENRILIDLEKGMEYPVLGSQRKSCFLQFVIRGGFMCQGISDLELTSGNGKLFNQISGQEYAISINIRNSIATMNYGMNAYGIEIDTDGEGARISGKVGDSGCTLIIKDLPVTRVEPVLFLTP